MRDLEDLTLATFALVAMVVKAPLPSTKRCGSWLSGAVEGNGVRFSNHASEAVALEAAALSE